MAKKRAQARLPEGLGPLELGYLKHSREVLARFGPSTHAWARLPDLEVPDLLANDNGKHYGVKCAACGYGFCVECFDQPPEPNCPARPVFVMEI